MHAFTQLLIQKLSSLANAEKAVAMKAYMKNQFAFLGIQTNERRQILQHYQSRNVIKDEQELAIIVKELWTLPQREFQYCGLEILLHNKKL